MASQSLPVPWAIASKAANAAGNHGSFFRSCASSSRVSPVIAIPTARVPGPIKASLLTFFGYRAAYCVAIFVPHGVAEQVHPGKPEVYAQRLDVIDQVIAAVGRGVLGNRGPAGAAQVQDDKPTVRGQAAEVAEVDGVRGTPREADDRVAVSDHAVGEPGSVRCGEGRHEANPANNNQVIQPGYSDGSQVYNRAMAGEEKSRRTPETLTEEQAERMLADMNDVIRAGEEMRKLRTEMIKLFTDFGWTQDKIAQLTDMSQPAVSKQVKKHKEGDPLPRMGLSLEQRDAPWLEGRLWGLAEEMSETFCDAARCTRSVNAIARGKSASRPRTSTNCGASSKRT